jgi:hypothetical protein
VLLVKELVAALQANEDVAATCLKLQAQLQGEPQRTNCREEKTHICRSAICAMYTYASYVPSMHMPTCSSTLAGHDGNLLGACDLGPRTIAVVATDITNALPTRHSPDRCRGDNGCYYACCCSAVGASLL